MTCTGSWDAEQVVGEDVNPAGLTFTATYSAGSPKDVTSDVTVSPAKWGDTPGSQTATFSYTEGGTTVTTTKAATVVARVADPVITCADNSVTITCDTASATIYYTDDGTTPSAESGTEYTAAIDITETTIFKAIAVKDGMADSAVVTEECEYVPPAVEDSPGES